MLTLGTGGFVPKNGVFEATFAVRVLAPGTGTKPEITGNLMKMRTENTAGVAQPYRDQAEYGLLPPPNLSYRQGASSRQTNLIKPIRLSVADCRTTYPDRAKWNCYLPDRCPQPSANSWFGLLRTRRAGVGPTAIAVGPAPRLDLTISECMSSPANGYRAAALPSGHRYVR